MAKSTLLFIVLVISLNPSIDCDLPNGLVIRNESTDCLMLCNDNTPIDAITSIHLSPDLLITSGECAFVFNPNQSNGNQISHGFKHSFAFSEIEDMFVIGNKTDVKFVILFASGSVVQVISANSTHSSPQSLSSNVFEGLSVDLSLPIDSAFVSTDQRFVYLIQGSKYWAFEMSQDWKDGAKQLSGYPRTISDFGLNADHRITSAFTDSSKIFFLSIDLVYVFDIENIDSKSGLIAGKLLQKTIQLKDFLKCPKRCSNDSNDWFELLVNIWSKGYVLVNEYFDLIWLLISLILLIVSLTLLVYTCVRCSQIKSYAKSHKYLFH